MTQSVPQWVSNVPVPETFLLGIAAGVWLHQTHPWPLPGTRRMQRLVGGTFIASGSYVVVRSVRATRQVDLTNPQRLVTIGPYAISRNPMYGGWALLHLGAGVASGSGWVLAALPAVMRLLHPQIRREERDLGRRFGKDYERYRAAVPRYLTTRRVDQVDLQLSKQ